MITARRTRRPTLLALAVAAALAIAVAGCGGSDNTAAPEETAATTAPAEAAGTTAPPSDTGAAEGVAEEPAEETVSVDYLTSFSTFGRDAYVLVAEEKGFFDEVGLDVTINPGSGTVDVMKLIAAGQADFGPGDGATAIITIANQSLPVKAVAAVQQETLAALAALESSGITEPADLEGKTFADSPASTVRILFPFYAEAAGFDDSTVEFVPSTPPDLPRLLASGRVDVIGQFVVGEALLETAADQPVVFLPYSDYLPDLYGNLIMARTEMIEQEPEVVERFLSALLKGLEYSIANPEETGEILAAAFPEQDPVVAASEVEIMGPFVQPEGFAGPIGEITPERMEENIRLLDEAGALENEVTVEDVYAPGFVPAS